MMKNRIVSAVAGLIVGAAIVFVSHGLWHDVEPPRQALTPVLDSGARSGQSESYVAEDTGTNNASTTTVSSDESPASTDADLESNSPTLQTQPPVSASVSETPEPGPMTVLQEPYASMVAPRPATETMSMSELYEAFSTEPRDDVWAYPMEMGIKDYSARRAANYRTSLEYVGCQSRYCLIAGVVYGGGQADVNGLFTEMMQSGWWQSYSGHTTTGSNDGADYRFVSVFPRNPEFVLRK